MTVDSYLNGMNEGNYTAIDFHSPDSNKATVDFVNEEGTSSSNTKLNGLDGSPTH